MRRFSLLTASILAFLTLANPARAGTDVGYGRRFGLGLMLGEPTGITGKYWVGAKNALDFGLGFGWLGRHCDRWGCYGYSSTSINVDYLWHPSVLARGAVELNWHVGIGGRIWLWDYADRYNREAFVDAAVRLPIGLDLMFNSPNFLELYTEIAPSLFVYGGLGFDGGIGIRFYF